MASVLNALKGLLLTRVIHVYSYYMRIFYNYYHIYNVSYYMRTLTCFIGPRFSGGPYGLGMLVS